MQVEENFFFFSIDRLMGLLGWVTSSALEAGHVAVQHRAGHQFKVLFQKKIFD
jgi:hypothetical protein